MPPFSISTLTTKRPRVLLLDMDGVVLHQPNLHRFVAMRVGAFVRKRLDAIIPGITYDQAEHINRALYTTYGHTLIGMNRVFKTETSIQEFNSSVYDSTTLSYVHHFQDDKEVNKRANEVRQVLERCHMNRMPVYIFSNAPICWSRTVLDVIGLPIPTEFILGSDHPLFERGGQLKPDVGLYNEVSRLMTYRHSSDHELVFVDDSLMNLRPCVNKQGWCPILLNPHMPAIDTDGMFIRPSITSALS